MPLPTKKETHKYQFTDDIRFFQKAIVLHPTEKKILTIRRSDTDLIRPGTWDLPGGNLLYGELHHPGLRREILEEAGLEVEDIRELKVITHFDAKLPMYYIIIGSMCKATSDSVQISDEHSAFQWITPKEFLALDPRYVYKEERALDLQSPDLLRDFVYLAFVMKELRIK